MERSIEIYRYLFIIKNKNEKRMIEGECQEVFYLRDHPFERSTNKYNDNHKKYKYLCQHKNKYFCKDCGGSQICDHKKVKSNCKLCIFEKKN